MKSHPAVQRSGLRLELAVACSAVTVIVVGVTVLATGPVRLIAVAILLAAFVGASWLLQRAQFAALGPAVGLALACLILIGLALAAVGALSVGAIAAALGAVTLAAAWASTTLHPVEAAEAAEAAERRTPLKRPSSFAVGGAIIFAAAAACSVYYSAASATADSDRASSPALWAYPVGDQLDVGVQEPAGQQPAWHGLTIVVTQAGVAIATWKDIRVAPGQTWQAPPVALTGDGPTQVVAFQGGSVVARLSG